MMADTSFSHRWNIFAAVLEDILQRRGLGLEHLDKGDKEQRIHPEKVQRLQRSLETPKHFVILSEEDITKVATRFNFSEKEMEQLRAAIVATSVEMTLFDRIADEKALKIAWNVYQLVEAAMRAHNEEDEWDEIRADDGLSMTPLEREIGSTIDRIDRAILAFYLSRITTDRLAREAYARQALADFTIAFSNLGAVADALKETDAWQYWFAVVTQGMQQAQERLNLSS